jgi:uncharacterized coiled-coil DUF342 family protein
MGRKTNNVVLINKGQPLINQTKSYEELVVEFIREKYSLNEELAILRQRDEKAEEFKEYHDFAESCKRRAKEIKGV